MNGNRRIFFASCLLALALFVTLSVTSAWSGQKKNKKKADDNAQADAAFVVQGPVPEEIDRDISEMLGAWQIGDVERMHKYYADNASFVSGAYEPPIIGWQNYAAAYQQQRARVQGVQLVRRNTNIFFKGDSAWADYQWELGASVDGKPMSARGQTTLVFLKVSERWLIVHNHTSQICEPPQAAPPAGGSQTPPPNPNPGP